MEKIGNLFAKSPWAVLDRMRALGIVTRTLSEAMTKFPKMRFSCVSEEAAYLTGLRTGDLFVRRHGLNIRIATSTTHPAMVELIQDSFSPYGRVVVYPKFLRKWNLYEWGVYCDLHPTFDFLLSRFHDFNGPFLEFLAGFFDAEGTVTVKRQSKSKTVRVLLEINNNNLELLRRVQDELSKLGFHATVSTNPSRRKGTFVGLGRYNKNLWTLVVGRKQEAVSLLQSLNLKHREKVWKRTLAISFSDRRWAEVEPLLLEFRHLTKREVDYSNMKAKRQYWGLHGMA